MPQDNRPSPSNKLLPQAAPIEVRAEKKSVGTTTVEARIWAAANQITRDADEPFEEEQ
jgi:hypothetical protein